MTRADVLAGELQAGIDSAHQELDAIPDQRWNEAVTTAEGWRVGHAAHHIGEGYLQHRGWIQQAVERGKPVVLDPAVDIPAVNEANARCLAEHGDESRAATMALLRANAARLIDTVRTLSDAQLDQPMMAIKGGQEFPGSQVAVPMALRHVTMHMSSIRAAT